MRDIVVNLISCMKFDNVVNCCKEFVFWRHERHRWEW